MTRRAYRTLVRLETAAHRAKHKGLCEMCFTALAGHECFASHDTWKLETKPAMWKIRSAMGKRERLVKAGREDGGDSECSGESWQRMGQLPGVLQQGEDGVRDQAPHRRGALQACMPARAPMPGKDQGEVGAAAHSGGTPPCQAGVLSRTNLIEDSCVEEDGEEELVCDTPPVCPEGTAASAEAEGILYGGAGAAETSSFQGDAVGAEDLPAPAVEAKV